ncbi:Integrator complex subunit 1, partial [Clonorchis sinensis]
VGALISLSNKSKRVTPSSSLPSAQSGLSKKPRTDFLEVDASDFVVRTEIALNSGNLTLAESLVLSALNQLRTASGPLSSASAVQTSSTGFRINSGTSGSRLLTSFSLGLLVLAQSHPTLFSRVAILDQLMLILALTPRELGISLPPSAVATIAARVRGLHVLVANLIYLALEGQVKWPSHLIKVYLEDSLTDRVWVDQDECRLFVLNIETAFPQTYGDPRGLFTILASPANTSSSGQAGQASSAVHAVLGLSTAGTGTLPVTSKSQDEIADAVSTAVRSQPVSLAKLIHGSDLASSVTPRFESCRQAVEVIIVNTLRDALSRRGASVTVQPATSTAGTALMGGAVSCSSTAAPISSGASAVSGEATLLRSLIRTVGMAVGLSEIRGMVTTRLEPWLTNPKVQLFSIGLAALLATNCRLGGLSPHDLDLMVSMLFRVRYRLFKPNMQLAFLECFCHIVKAAPTNLYCLIHLCAAAELRPTPSTDSLGQKGTPNQYFSQAVLNIAENVRMMSQGNLNRGSSENTPQGHQQLNSATMAAVAAGAATAASRSSGSVYFILSFLHQNFGLQWVRVMGNLLHDRLLSSATSCFVPRDHLSLSNDQLIDQLNSELSPLYHFLREICRNWRLSSSESVANPSLPAIFHSSAAHSYLPCAELANALMHDRAHRGTTTAAAAANTIVASLLNSPPDKTSSGGHIASFQFYLSGLVSLIAALQMLSASRPYLTNNSTSSRRASNYNEAMKAHQTTLRQIRLGFVRWIKTILPLIINAAVQTVSDVMDPNGSGNMDSAVVTCFTLLKPATLIRRALLLESVTPVTKAKSDYELAPEYPVRSIWLGEQEQISLQTRLVTDVCLPEKLCHQLLILGLEPTWQLLSSVDAVEMVCELVWRAASLARDSGMDTISVVKAEQLIDLMYASCTYVCEQQLPAELAELAYASVYWHVSTTTVVLAAHCIQTCGFHLWSNYPTIRRLMEMVITGEFTSSTRSVSAAWDASVRETERLNAEMELQLIVRLETMLLNPPDNAGNAPFTPVVVTPDTSKLVGRLVHNNPRGPCRLPPADVLENFQFLAGKLELGRRLWRCRHPDFLLELLRSQSLTCVSAQPWLMRLVESSGSEFELLPVQCLCEYLLYDTLRNLDVVQEEFIPLLVDESGHPGRSESSGRNTVCANAIRNQSQRNMQLICRLREEIRTFANVSTSDALVHCFFTRLSDLRYMVRWAVRQCLHRLTGPTSQSQTPQPQHPVCSWLQVLQCLKTLPVFRNDLNTEISGRDTSVEAFQHFLSAILASLLVETDLDIVTAYLIFLSQLTNDTGFISWRPVITGLTSFVLRRPTILSALLHRQSKITVDSSSSLLTAYAGFESLADVFVRYLEYNCTAAEAIPVDENKSVFVTWSPERQCPLEFDCIQAQLILLTHINSELPTEKSSDMKDLFEEDVTVDRLSTACWLRLQNAWFLPDPEKPGAYRLPQLSPLVFPMPLYTGTDLDITTCHLSFQCQVGHTGSPVPHLSTELRCRLIQTNQVPLVSAALRFVDDDQLLEVTRNLPVFVLHPSTMSLLVAEIQSRLDGASGLHGEEMLNYVQRLLTISNRQSNKMDVDETRGFSGPRGKPEHIDLFGIRPTLAPDPDIPSTMKFPAGSCWSHLISALELLEDSQQSTLLCQLMVTISTESNTREIWLENLYQELQFLWANCTSPKPRMHTRKSPPSTSISQVNENLRFFHSLASDPDLIDIIRPLVTLCITAEPEPKSLGMKIAHNLELLLDPTKLTVDLRRVLSQMFQCSRSARSPPDTPSKSLSPPVLTCAGVTAKPSADCLRILFSEASTMDSVCIFGLSELPAVSTASDPSLQQEIAHVPVHVEQFVFKSLPGLVEDHKLNCGEYVLTELLNQANPDLLRQCFYRLLQHEEVNCANSTRVLNFIQAVLTLPRVSFSVPRSEARGRPDVATALAELAQLTWSEALCLVSHVLNECRNLCETTEHELDLLLSKRTPLLDLAITRWSKECFLYLEYNAGFVTIEDIQNKLSYLQPESTYLFSKLKDANAHIGQRLVRISQRLMLNLYMRWPGSVQQLTSAGARHLVAFPGTKVTSDSDQHLNRPEIDRLGPLILVGMTSENSLVRDTARLASKSLVIYHPRAFLSLLPILSTLSDGLVERNRAQFSSKGSHLLFSSILHLLELLATTTAVGETSDPELLTNRNTNMSDGCQPILFSDAAAYYSSSIDRMFVNLIGVLTRSHGTSRKSGSLAVRLIRLLQHYGRLAPWIRKLSTPDSGRPTEQPGFRVALDFLGPRVEDAGCLLDILGCQQFVHGPKLSGSSPDNFSKERWALDTMLCSIRPGTSSHTTSIPQLLEDLDDVSKRCTEVLLQYKLELTRLLSHSNENVSTTAVKLLLRLLSHYPHLSAEIVQSFFMPLLSNKINLSDSLISTLLLALPDLCILAAPFAPKLMHAYAERILFGSVTDSTLRSISAVEDSVRRLTLDGLDDAGIEHAASALISRSHLIRGN